jgi:prepilin-type N-terminal cleavage/methylation domain-containing protein
MVPHARNAALVALADRGMRRAHDCIIRSIDGREDGGWRIEDREKIPSSIFHLRSSTTTRRAFSILELLVVVAILLALSSLALAVYHANSGSDRTRSAARIAQSALLGAKDRALHAKEVRGVRCIRDSADPSLVTGFAYLAPIAPLQYGSQVSGGKSTIQILRPDADNDGQGTDATTSDAILVAGTGVDWLQLDANGFLSLPTTRIRIPAGSGAWYTLRPIAGQTVPPYFAQPRGATVLLTLASPFATPDTNSPNVVAVAAASSKASCEIELASSLLPFHQPMPLPSAVVIDLDYSSSNVQALSLKGLGTAGSGPASTGSADIDIMYSPRGMLTGPVAALGPLHFLLNNIRDASANLNPIDPRNQGDKLVLTVFPQTGLVATFPIDPTDANHDGIADDLFHFAKLGRTAGQ